MINNEKMINNKMICVLIGVLLNTPICFSGNADSLLIDSLLHKSAYNHFRTAGERIMFFAESLEGVPYKSGTLDTGVAESLVIRTDSLDCTTYVETVLALYLASKKHNPGYKDYEESLKKIRYRGGVVNGYVSRLHYFSDWVKDNETKNIFCEHTNDNTHEVRVFSLNYMTEHADLYRQLKDNDSLLSEMRKVETKWKGFEMSYIPKKNLDLSESELMIKNGDILSLTTNISGLDVVHLGFASWIDGRLHLLHASSLHGKVVTDPLSLFDYLKDKKKHTGVRVIRVK